MRPFDDARDPLVLLADMTEEERAGFELYVAQERPGIEDADRLWCDDDVPRRELPSIEERLRGSYEREVGRRRRERRSLEERFCKRMPARATCAALSADQADSNLVRCAAALAEIGSKNLVVLAGPAGTGKTVAACWMAWQFHQARRRDEPRFVRAADYAVAGRYDGKRDEWHGCGFLVLDDLGAEYADAKGSFVSDLDALVDAHYSDMRALVITTNLATPQAFKARYGERTYDRLREAGTWISFAGASRRGSAGKTTPQVPKTPHSATHGHAEPSHRPDLKTGDIPL